MLLRVSGKLTIIYCVLSIGISEQHVYEVLDIVLQFTNKICCYAVSCHVCCKAKWTLLT